ncbi:MAG TPA: lipopolysaccharide heptosyltransferase family protein [Candidatus Omnitrophica bacterium]|nr:lipopolysaccharide heptosyltransferase family protein [Candidatus Omnitrophota bacterium]
MSKQIFKKILIMCHSNIGDVCYDLVVIDPLRRQFPDAGIFVLTSLRAACVAEGYKDLEKVIIFDKHAKDRNFLGRLRLVTSLIRERFDLVIVLKSSLMYKFLCIPHSWSLKKYLGCSPAEAGIHGADTYLAFLRSHGVEAKQAIFNFVLDKTEEDFCNTFFKEKDIDKEGKLVGILPLAGWSLKSWPIDRCNKLATLLKEKYGIKTIALGDIEDSVFKELILPHISDDLIFAGKTTLKQAIALLKCCDVFIAPDSGLSHLASTMGIKTIGLYGPTPKNYIYPYFHQQDMIFPRKKLECMPCYPELTHCICKERGDLLSDCMKGISVEDVLDSVKRNLEL